jgi:hypothetical protein
MTRRLQLARQRSTTEGISGMNSAAKTIIAGMVQAARAADPDLALDDLAGFLPRRERQAETAGPEVLLLNQAATARLLGVSRFCVYCMAKDGQIKPVMIRGARRYRRADVLRLAGLA